MKFVSRPGCRWLWGMHERQVEGWEEMPNGLEGRCRRALGTCGPMGVCRHRRSRLRTLQSGSRLRAVQGRCASRRPELRWVFGFRFSGHVTVLLF